jgi:diaminopimelate decarboxylase
VRAGVRSINVESAGELREVALISDRAGRRARVAVRVNPAVDANTHRHLTTGVDRSKFGVSPDEATDLFAEAARSPSLECVGLHVHVGSQMSDASVFARVRSAVGPVLDAYRSRWGEPRLVDIGGGFGVRYNDEPVPPLEAFARAAADAFADTGGTLVIEPGRSLIAEAGVLLTRLLYRKPQDRPVHYVVDAGMTDLLRPALYDAHHAVRPVDEPALDASFATVDVVGPVCESSDVLARARRLPDAEPGALFAIMTAGAYGFAQASTYNSRPRPAEVLVSRRRYAVIRKRETIDDLTRGEIVPPWLGDGR